jgi:hypothetical protein
MSLVIGETATLLLFPNLLALVSLLQTGALT